jgi:predicted ATPase
VEGVLALLGVAGLVMAIMANLTNVATFLEERRRRRLVAGSPTGSVAPAPVAAGPDPAPSHHGTLAIRTPDQRVRVFVSSTLHEVAEERVAARGAIETLRLTPVLFEMGARPHAPRDLYRAYLAQSDVFVAIYAHRYGWVAPGESVSGLEDEYLRSGDRPKLVYVKRQEGPREAALEALLARIRDDDRVSYRAFGDADELAALLADDLASLLSERFDRRDEGWANTALAPVPTPWGPLLGREAELARVCDLVLDPAVRLVTLVGPGGIGKSRLALEIADRVRTRMPDGVAFVSLQGVVESDLVDEAIAAALGVRASEGRDELAAVRAFLADRRMLVVLDNFEHVLDAAPLLALLLEGAPGLQLLVTSRSLLRLSAERVVPIGPLPTVAPDDVAGRDAAFVLATAAANPAVQLFMWRAQAVRPDLELTEANAPIVLDVVAKLDGWPLAIVLAASRAAHLSLAALRERLARRLDLLVGGARDLPNRQQTMRATIAWSLELLSPPARTLLSRLSVFVGGFSWSTLERLVQDLPRPSPTTPDAVEGLGELLDQSLVVRADTPAGERFMILELVREAAAEALAASGERRAVEDAHARVFLELARAAAPLIFDGVATWYMTLSLERGNIRTAVRHVVETDDVASAAGFASSLWLHWWMHLQAAEHLPWIARFVARDDLADPVRAQLLTAAAALSLQIRDVVASARYLDLGDAMGDRLGARARATAAIGRALCASFTGDHAAMARHAVRARELGAEARFGWGESFACVLLARVGLGSGDGASAVRWAGEAIRLTTRSGDRQSGAWAHLVLGVTQVESSRHDEALTNLLEAARSFGSLGVRSGDATVLQLLAYAACARGDLAAGAFLAGAASCAQAHHGVLALEPEHGIVTRGLEAAKRVAPTVWRSAFAEGEGTPIDVALAFAASRSAARAA